MMAFCLLLLISLLSYNTGFSAEISVFVKTGDPVHLDIQTKTPPKFDLLSWTNDKSESIVRYISGTKSVNLHPSYKDRVDFNTETFSLTLKNMQKTDSGLYRARTTGDLEAIIVTYRVSVIDAVDAPVLTVKSNWSSPDPCSFTCTGHNIIISSIYNSSSCSTEEVTSENYTLKLNCSDGNIMCNYSNPVSWKTELKKVNELCTADRGTFEQSSTFPHWIIGICLFILVLLVAGLIGFYFYNRKKGAQQNEQTVYAEVGENIKAQKSQEMLVKSGDSEQPDVTVETNHTSPNQDSGNQGASLTENSKPNAPTTIYCAIQKQPKPPKSDTENTIYAMVSKPPASYESVHPIPQ